MSDCSTHAFDVPMCERGRIDQPRKPSLKELHQMHGEPPWTLTLPWPEALPIEAVEFLGTVVIGGKRFVEEVPTCAGL